MPRFKYRNFRDIDPTGLEAPELKRRLWDLRDALKQLDRELSPAENRVENLRKFRRWYLVLISRAEQARVEAPQRKVTAA